MKKNTIITIGSIIAIIVIIALGVWQFLPKAGAPAPAKGSAAAKAALPTPSLATITAIDKATITVRMQDATSTSEVQIAPSTLIYQGGAPISSAALKKGQMVAVIFYPASVGAADIAQSITVVSTQ